MTYYKNVHTEEFYNSNNYGVMEVIGRKAGKLKVRFISTGYETWANRANVVAGKVRDELAKKAKDNFWFPYKKEYATNSGSVLKVFQKNGVKVRGYFSETGTVVEVLEVNAIAGKVKDPYAVTVYGKGSIGKFCKDTHKEYWKQARQLWSNMMKRCYSEKDKRGYFGEATVDSRWLTFSNFLEDIPKLEGFEHWLNRLKTGQGEKYNLDKDLKSPNPYKVYSKELCWFIPESQNKAAGARNK